MEASRVNACLNSEGCLFCRLHDGGFRSREHPFPESLGNDEIVLPPGVVCDRCNFGRLSDLDNAFLNYPPISLLRTMYGIKTKAGKRPMSKWGNARVSMPTEANIYIETNSEKTWRTVGPNQYELQLRGSRPITVDDTATMARALWKMALEFAYIDHGGAMFDSRLDETRRMILGQEPAHGWVALARKGDPNDRQVSLRYWWPPVMHETGEEGMPVLMGVFGMGLGTDLLKRVPVQVPPELAEHGDLNVF
ncbi:MAG: hypothetical protein H0V84_05220 [Actinobacteria bacterium]|nr:hypothetical protein [Actinomycetota bacterium]